MLSKHAPLPARKRGEERLEKRDENTVIGLTPYPMLCRPCRAWLCVAMPPFLGLGFRGHY